MTDLFFFLHLFVVLSRKLPAGIKMLSRLHGLLQSVDSLCKKGTVSHRVSAVNNKREGFCQLRWYESQVLFFKMTEKQLYFSSYRFCLTFKILENND